MGEVFIRGQGQVSLIPEFTYTNSSGTLLEATTDYIFTKEDKKNWKLQLNVTGNLKFTKLGNAKKGIEVFVVGGGGGGASNTTYSGGQYVNGTNGGGGGGYTNLGEYTPKKNTEYSITIGIGGTGGNGGANGGASSAFGISADGGKGGSYQDYNYSEGGLSYYGGGAGGAGGSGGATGRTANLGTVAGGSDGANGGNNGGSGMGTYASTGIYYVREFREEAGIQYSQGGNSGGERTNGAANTGNGGTNGGNGGSGIVVIRNKRS